MREIVREITAEGEFLIFRQHSPVKNVVKTYNVLSGLPLALVVVKLVNAGPSSYFPISFVDVRSVTSMLFIYRLLF